MIQTAEEVLENICALPMSEQVKFFELLEIEKSKNSETEIQSVLGIETVSTVYFAESDYFDRNVLGRIGWLDRVKLGLIEQEGKLFLSEYSKT